MVIWEGRRELSTESGLSPMLIAGEANTVLTNQFDSTGHKVT